MTVLGTLLDKAKQKRGIPTDMALGARLGRSRQLVSEWRSGNAYPDEELIVALAELAGDDPGEWLVAVKAVRADGKAGRAWADLAKRLGSITAMLLCAIGLSMATPQKAHAFNDLQSKTPGVVPTNAYYVIPEASPQIRAVTI